jgi:hypothetical protein
MLFGDTLSTRGALAMSDLTMTVRTYAAIHALTGILSKGPDQHFRENIMRLPEDERMAVFYSAAAHNAVMIADTLIAELSKEYDDKEMTTNAN